MVSLVAGQAPEHMAVAAGHVGEGIVGAIIVVRAWGVLLQGL